jgi:hypothetical protein
MFCDFREIDPIALVPLSFGETIDPSGAPSPDAVKSYTLVSRVLKPFNQFSEPLNLPFEAMASGALKSCSSIPELLNLAVEVTLIARQMLFSHRAPRTAPEERRGNRSRIPAFRIADPSRTASVLL